MSVAVIFFLIGVMIDEHREEEHRRYKRKLYEDGLIGNKEIE